MLLHSTPIPGLSRIDLDLFPDERGSFKESWQAAKLADLGLTGFQPVQCNISDSKFGTIRGIHAEPWDKYIHVPYGSVFAAFVDLRQDQPTFGQTYTTELNSSNAIFVPKGVGNSFQATSELAIYTYLVNDHWKPGLTYPAVAFDDPDLAIPWPVPSEQWIVSAKDRQNPRFREVFPKSL